MITLTLLHPVQFTPVQCWTFEDESLIRIGRSTDNHVVLYSAVVSRHHVEVRCEDDGWVVVSLGANGTYMEGKRIERVPIRSGMVIRLARSGPNIQIHVGVSAKAEAKKITGDRTISQRRFDREEDAGKDSTQPLNSFGAGAQPPDRKTSMEPPTGIVPGSNAPCAHARKTPDLRFCIDCGVPLKIQQVIGNYQVVKLLGQGEMGSTFLVWRDGKHLVLKTLNAGWRSNARALERFAEESKALSRLRHAGLPQWRDFFVEAGQPYLVMEMIYGRSLHQQVTKWGAVPQKQAIAWILELCKVLEYLHGQTPSVLHCDIRPENLIRRSTPTAMHEVALIDFGGVRIVGLQSGLRLGSIGYIAPEQQKGITTPASDLYSLGATLAFLLSGQEPDAFYRYREQGHRFYPEYVPGLTPMVAQVVRKLTNPEPSDRYGSAQEVAEALREIA
ncbi:MAG: FHA domain-containing protein [Leptolyngbyaceae cyanobacterium SU_3_3]|nr:FHA domain-containing protein [Leptolyngbyaceae cyanobacterium SU_3_3]